MFWFNRRDQRALFVDKRRETCASDSRQGRREIVVDPDMIADFRELPFADATFTLVVFDPPHTFSGAKGWMAKKYGSLERDWRADLTAGFKECFRVLCPLGTLVFKWNEHRVPVSTVLSLTPEKPLFGQRCGATARTHWIVFHKSLSPMKTLTQEQETAPLSLGEELKVEIRRGEELLDHYVQTGQKAMTAMIARDLDAAKGALATGNERWMMARRDVLRGYEE